MIVVRDLVRFVRNPARTALLFALPLILAGIFVVVFGGDEPPVITIKVLIHDEDGGLLSRLLLGAADGSEAGQYFEFEEVGAEGYDRMEEGDASALLHIPAGFTNAVLDGRETTLTVIKNPAHRFLPQVVEEGAGVSAVLLSQVSRVLGPELQQIRGLQQDEGFPGDAAVAGLSTQINSKLRHASTYVLPPAITLETTTLEAADGPDVNILAVVLPGLAIMGILFLAQAATTDVLRERETGLLRHLLTAPVSVGDYLLGKSLSVLVVTALGFTLLIGIGIAGGVQWGPPVAVAALAVASAVAASGTLLLIMGVVRTERQGGAVSTIVIMVWSLLGGAFIPLSQLPDAFVPVARTSLVYWATDGFNQLILRGGGLAEIVPNLAALLAVGGLFLLLGTWSLGRRMKAGTV